ncbi:MAG: site-specific integrase [Nitrospirae bacterium]|nr:site-specific integrase [Nitrospirota bacterium]
MKKHRKDGTKIVPKRRSVEPVFITKQDWRRLMGHFKKMHDNEAARDRMVFVTGVLTGLRLEGLQWLDVGDLVQEDAAGRRTVRGRFTVIEKGDVEREVPISAEFAREVEAYLKIKKHLGEPVELDSPLFCGRGDARIGYSTVQYVVTRRCLGAGLADYSAGPPRARYSVHDLRHTFAVNWLIEHKNMGLEVALTRLAGIMGHADIRTTQKYLKVGVDGEL